MYIDGEVLVSQYIKYCNYTTVGHVILYGNICFKNLVSWEPHPLDEGHIDP